MGNGMTLSQFMDLPPDVRQMLIVDAGPTASWMRVGGPDGSCPTVLDWGTPNDEPEEGDWVDDGFILTVREVAAAHNRAEEKRLG